MMTISVPNYLLEANIQDNSLGYKWDDWRRLPALEKLDKELVARLKGISQRAVLAFMCGTAEWIVHRFSRLCDTSAVSAYLEVAWAKIVHVRYGDYTSVTSWQNKFYNSEEWYGPVKKPIADALLRVENAIEVLAYEGNDPVEDAGLIATLACYIMTDATPYKNWCGQVMERFESIYKRDPEDELGDVVPRQAVDPDYDFNVKDTEFLINEYLASLDYHSNIFLSSPEDMLEISDDEDEDFKGTPYIFDIVSDRKLRLEKR